MASVAALALPLVLAAPLAAQAPRPGPFVPLGSRLDRLVSWAVDEGALGDIDPLTRPFRIAAVRRAVAEEDTAKLSPAGRTAWRWLVEELGLADDSTSVVAEVAAATYTNGRRDSFRPGGSSGLAPAGGIRATLVRGSIVAVVNPAFENRLRDDPEYSGKTDRFIAGRMQEAYVALTAEPGDLFFGRMARNWGPPLFDGLIVSPSVYAIEALVGSLRLSRFELTSVAQRLDDQPLTGDASAAPVNRYFFAHRLAVRAGRGVWLAFTEAGVYTGQGRGFEPAFHAPLNLALLSEFNEPEQVNIFFGTDFAAPLGRGFRLTGSALLDDIQVDRKTLTDRRPTSYGLSIVLRKAVSRLPVHASLGYTRVSSLTYRHSADPYSVYAFRGVGLARNFSDYDQVLGRLEYRPTDRWYLSLDAGYLRQGSGDFRSAFPTDSVLAQRGQGFLVAPVRRAPGVRATLNADVALGVEVRAEVGVTRKLGGGTEWIGGLSGRVRLDALRARLGGAFPGVEAGANRAWP